MKFFNKLFIAFAVIMSSSLSINSLPSKLINCCKLLCLSTTSKNNDKKNKNKKNSTYRREKSRGVVGKNKIEKEIIMRIFIASE